MHPGFNKIIMQQAISTEIIYSFIIIICSLMIYFGTKELYELSSYKGIKYFRQAFLFFAIAFFFRSFIKYLLVYFNVNAILEISPKTFNLLFSQTTLLIFMYFSFIAVFYLLYSVMWKKWNHSNKIYLFHFLTLAIAVIITISRNPLIYLGLNILLIIFILFVFLFASKNKKHKKNNLYIIYILLFIFWILNIIDILVPTIFIQFRILIYLISLGIFLTILYKVLKKVGN